MRLQEVKRRAIALSQEGLIRESSLQPDAPLPLLVRPAVDGVNLIDWTRSNRKFFQAKLKSHGAILFRGFAISTTDEFEQFMMALADELLDYSYRSTPRTVVSGKIYTSTEYPAHQSIPLHNEMSYSRNWPMIIGFFCVQPATEGGGETPIADSRRVFELISPAIRERFERKNVMYVRHYSDALDLPWQEVFQTEDRGNVEAQCRAAGIEFEWKQNELRTWQVCQSMAKHPETGEMVWFNQAHLFHVSSLKEEIRESLMVASGGEPPRNALYGDGSPIKDSVLEEIRAAYESEAVAFPWEKRDILLLDNMLTAHGRKPYRGARRVVVGMAQSFGSEATN